MSDKGPYGQILGGLPWKQPMFFSWNDEGDGELCLCWVKGDKRLTVYIEDAHLDWLKSWGPSPTDDMVDRDEAPASFAEAYRWFVGDEEGTP